MLSLTSHQTRLLLTLVNGALRRCDRAGERVPARWTEATTARRTAFKKVKRILEGNLHREEGADYVPGPRRRAASATPPPGSDDQASRD